MRTLTLLLPLAAMAAAATPASAREVDRQEVHEAFTDPLVQERRMYCRDTQMVTLADGSEYRACTDWRAQNRTRIVRSYAALDGPDEDTDANLGLARDCFDMAVASMNDPYREVFDKDAFLAGAQVQFAACANSRQLQRADQYSLRIYATRVWLGGR